VCRYERLVFFWPSFVDLRTFWRTYSAILLILRLNWGQDLFGGDNRTEQSAILWRLVGAVGIEITMLLTKWRTCTVLQPHAPANHYLGQKAQRELQRGWYG
jgi:hypothetical protein